jgi:hypothetical protein
MTASSKRAGERAEGAALERLPVLRYVSDETAEHYDAVARDDHGDLLEDDPVEIKSAAVVLASDDPGRFYLREHQHERLLEDDGWYLFVVCSPNDDRRILAYAFERAADVDDDLVDCWWSAGDDRDDYRQIRWTSLFAEDDLEEGSN